MLLRTVAFYLLFVAAYFGLWKAGALHFHFDEVKWDYDTFVKAEHYAYEEKIKTGQVVLVGSSLTCQVKPEFNYPFYNISISGRTALDGMEIVMRKPEMPAAILIETNVFDRARDSSIDYRLYTPGIEWLKRNFFFLRVEYKMHNLIPINIPIANKVLGLFVTYTGLYNVTKDKQALVSSSTSNSELFKSLVRNNNKAETAEAFDKSEIDIKCNDLANAIKYFKAKGVKVILLEVPMSSSIEQSDKWQYKKVMLGKLSRDLSIPYLYVPDSSAYQFSFAQGDGIHLHKQDIKRFNRFIADSVSAYMH